MASPVQDKAPAAKSNQAPLPRRWHVLFLGRRAKRQKRVQGLYQRLLDKPGLTPDQILYLRNSWWEDVSRSQNKAARSSTLFAYCRFTQVMGALSLPILTALSAGQNGKGGHGFALVLTSFFVSLTVALATAMQRVWRYGQQWKTDKGYAYALERDAWSYILDQEEYAALDPAGAVKRFFERLTSLRNDMEAGVLAAIDENPDVATDDIKTVAKKAAATKQRAAKNPAAGSSTALG
jgi:Protein of unknown function (DUF4231)